MSCPRLVLVFFALLSIHALFASAAGGTPRDSPTLADRFMANFTRSISTSGLFTAGQIVDMNAISDNMMASVNRLERSGRISKSNLHALIMASAASMAEIAANEQVGFAASANIQVTPALAKRFMTNSMLSISAETEFTPSQIDDMNAINYNMMDNRLARRGRISKSSLQALIITYASSIAEITATEQGGLTNKCNSKRHGQRS